MSNKPAPAALAMRGIHAIRDDLPAGKGVNFATDFSLFFRDELVARFLKPAAHAGSVPCPPSSTSSSK